MKKNFEMVKGDTLAFVFEIEDFTEDLASCYFSCKKNSEDVAYVFQKSLENGITKLDTGKYKVRVAPEDTKTLQIGKYYYDLQIGVGEDIYTILRGQLFLDEEITGE